MSEHDYPLPPPPPPLPSSGIPISILVALAMEIAFMLVKFTLPTSWYLSERYFLLSTGIYSASALLSMMACADLVRRLPSREAVGARVATIASAAFFALILSGGVIDYLASRFHEKGALVWRVQSYGYLALYLVIAVGLIVAAGSFARVAAPAIGLLVVSVLAAPPPSLSTLIHQALGSASRYVFPIIGVAQLGLQVYLIREAARASTRDLPTEPTAPFALLGSALRARVTAMFVLTAFTLFAMMGQSIGAMKFAMVTAPVINIVAFIIFAIAALRAGRGLDDKLQVAFSIAGSAAVWCAGVLAIQTPAVFAMFADEDSFSGERNSEIAQAFAIAMPLVATLGVVVALFAVGSHVRRAGHHHVAKSIAPRTTTFVILMLTSVVVQLYVVPQATSLGQFAFLGLLAGAAGVAALLVAAGIFKRASEATNGTALPTATMLPPS